MFLVEEIAIEVLMIVAVVVAVACLAYLLQVSVRERVELRRRERERRETKACLLGTSARRAGHPQSRTRRGGEAAWREKRA